MSVPRSPARHAALVPALLLAVAGCGDPDWSPTSPGAVHPLFSASPGQAVVLDAANTVHMPIFGDAGGDPFAASCLAGHIAVGMAGVAGDWAGGHAAFIDIRLRCRQLLPDGSLGDVETTTTAHPAGPIATVIPVLPFSEDCPALVGILGQSSTQVTELSGECATVAEIMEGGSASSSIGPWLAAGLFMGDSPAAIDAMCPAGTVVTGMSGRAGHVLNAIGAICTPVTEVCAAGSYQDGGDCVPAPAGFFVPDHGMSFALPCALGHYQPNEGQVACLAAPIGFYVDALGATAATQCPPGTSTELPGSTSASFCEPVPGATPEGTDVKVFPKDPETEKAVKEVELTFDKVDVAGETTVQTKSLSDAESPPKPTGYKLPSDEKYYDIKTDAEFTGEVTVCVEFDNTDFPKKQGVKLLHYEDAAWKDITGAVDEEDDAVCGKTSSFSPFIVVQEIYAFSGFFRPVDNLPVLNRVNAGRAIPVKFSLGGDQGMGILAAGFPKSAPTECTEGSPVTGVDETVAGAGGSSLSYDPASQQYTYVWKTDSGWSNSCRQLVLRMDDGSEYRANFHFTR